MDSVKLRLLFPEDLTVKPVSYHLVKDYDLVFNIFQAHVKPGKQGDMIIELSGENGNVQQGIDFLRNSGITVQILTSVIVWDEDMCVHCGACTAVCSTGALSLNEDAMLVFDSDKCIACEQCVGACPSRVIKVNFKSEDE